MQTEPIRIACYPPPVPAFAGAAMEALYRSPFALPDLAFDNAPAMTSATASVPVSTKAAMAHDVTIATAASSSPSALLAWHASAMAFIKALAQTHTQHGTTGLTHQSANNNLADSALPAGVVAPASPADAHGTTPTWTYVEQRGAQIVAVFLYQLRGKQVHVLNAAIVIEDAQVLRLASFIFGHHQHSASIHFQSISHTPLIPPWPHQRINRSEDIVLALPATAQQYLDQLGKSTKKYIKYHSNRLSRHFPQHRTEISEAPAIAPDVIEHIVRLNMARMLGKQKMPSLDATQKQWLLRMTASHGFVCTTTIDGAVRAGVVCTRFKDRYFMHVIAHDPGYDDSRLGMLCCYAAICAAIARGGKEFHFLWGQGDYKYRLGGVRQDLDNLILFRTRRHYAMASFGLARNCLRGYLRQADLQSAAAASGVVAPLHLRLSGMALSALRKLHWSLLRRNIPRATAGPA